MFTLLLLFACSGGSDESSTSTPPTPSPTTSPGPVPQPTTPTATTDTTGTTDTDVPTADTSTGPTADSATEPTGDTGHSGRTGDTAPPPVVVCDPAPAITALPAIPGTYDPVPFAPRPDGWMWFGLNGGIYEGQSISASTLAYSHDAMALTLRDDTLWWIDDGGPPTIWRAEQGQAPVAVTTFTDGPGLYYTSDLELHPSGSAITWYIPPLEFGQDPEVHIAWVSPTGALHTTGVTGLSKPDEVGLVAYRADGTGLWASATDGFRAYAVDAEGRPDWSTVQQTIPWPGNLSGAVTDLLVDACDRIYTLSTTGYVAFSVDVGRVDPATGDYVRMGNVDHGYGWSYLRFGATPDRRTQVITMSGGWSTANITWESWDVGVPAP